MTLISLSWGWLIVAWFVVVTLVHEIAHYLRAKDQGNYKGWAWWPTPYIKLIHPFKNWHNYLDGLWASIITFPLFYLAVPSEFSLVDKVVKFIILIIILAAFDIFIAITQAKKKTIALRVP